MLTLGFLTHKHGWDKKFRPHLWWVAAGIGVVLLESFANYRCLSKTEALDLFLCFFAVVPIIFIYVKNLNLPGKSKQLANLSTGIFLIHPLMIQCVAQYGKPYAFLRKPLLCYRCPYWRD